MSGCPYYAGRRGQQRPRFPVAVPPGLNHSILTGTLSDKPRSGRSPLGDPVLLLRIEFPVARPEDPQTLLAWASCEVEVPQALAEKQGVASLQGGTPMLVAGPLSERWAVSNGCTYRSAVILALIAHPAHPGGADL
jgi:hypothetical protein